jgi:succinate dehydrogenase / fumarate reductase cytochrome b subunit
MPINNNNFVDKRHRRPVFLNLFVLRLPIGGIISILHRVTGVLLVFLIPLAVYVLDQSLSDPGFFQQLHLWLSQWWTRLILLIVMIMLFQHLFSGLRHLALDIDWGISRQTARLTAWLTLAATLLLAAGVEWWLQ